MIHKDQDKPNAKYGTHDYCVSPPSRADKTKQIIDTWHRCFKGLDELGFSDDETKTHI